MSDDQLVGLVLVGAVAVGPIGWVTWLALRQAWRSTQEGPRP